MVIHRRVFGKNCEDRMNILAIGESLRRSVRAGAAILVINANYMIFKLNQLAYPSEGIQKKNCEDRIR